MRSKLNVTILFFMIIVLPLTAFARTERDGAQCLTGTTIGANSSTAGTITYRDTNYYAVTLAGTGVLEVYTTGGTRTYGYLRDPSCNKLAENDNGGPGRNFRINYTITTPGTYFINVEHDNRNGTGNYTLVVSYRSDDHGDDCPEATTMALNTTTAGSIDWGGDNDYFEVTLTSRGELDIYTTFTGDNTDTYGYLLNASCNTIDNNDDSTDYNFRITRELDPGTYYVRVRHFDSGDSGTYNLRADFTSTVLYTISASVSGGTGGTISPAGSISVVDGGSQSFSITPSAGNTILDVMVDGASVGPVASYSFSGVSADRSIEAVFQVPSHLCGDLSDVPLDTRFKAAPANIMFVLDDSGSMDWEFMTQEDNGLFRVGSSSHYYIFDNPGDNLYSGTLSRGTDRMHWKSQWNGYNRLYYNPEVDYVAWPTLADANPDTPRSHPRHSGSTLNMDSSFDSLVEGDIIIDDLDETRFFKSPLTDPFVIDNTDTRFTVVQEPLSDAWRTGTYSTQAQDGSYLYTGYDGTYEAKWAPVDLPAGEYDVYVKWHADPGNATSVSYSIDLDGTNTATATVDQSQTIPGTPPDNWERIAEDIVIDVGHGAVTLTHTRSGSSDRAVADAVKFVPVGYAWDEADSGEAYDSHFWYTPEYGFHLALWRPNVTGEFEIYARWVDGGNRATNVPYVIRHDGGTDVVYMNQTANGGQWRQLGTGSFDLVAGSDVYMYHDRTTANDTVAVADSIRLVPVSTNTITIRNSHYYVWSETDSKPYLVVLDGTTSPGTIKYYQVDERTTGTDDVVEEGELFLVATPPDDVKTSRTYAQERQNFANWYSFYRRRELTATAAVSRTINQMEGVYVGINTINGNLRQTVLGVKAGGVDQTSNLLGMLYNLELRAQGTPLRQGLRTVGRYYDKTDNIKLNGSAGDDSPYASQADGGACQQAFAIVMTDGFWGGSSPSVGNQDAATLNPYDGSPYADSYDDTLADVAMKYYKSDLATLLPNDIQGNTADSATHQHMVTYGVSFGVRGTLVSAQENPTTYDYDLANDIYPTPWPRPWDGDQEKIDDLLHAAVNGRGLFLSAANPDDLIDSLLLILQDVKLRIGSASSVSVNGDELYEQINTSLRVFQSSYDSENWSGNVQSFDVNTMTGEVNTASPLWEARDMIQNQSWTSRIIATYDGSDGQKFRYADISATMKSMLDSNATTAERILNYIRGQNDFEETQGGGFRDRIYKLGDIVHSSPTFKHGVLYVGGNDGMLHAINANNGEELFAYVPKTVFPNLYQLSEPTYAHTYFVDLTPVVEDVELTSNSRSVTTLLVGGFGKGGKGFYGLDVSSSDTSNPSQAPTVSSETDLAGRVLWEYPNSSTPSALKTVTSAANTSPIEITVTGHGLSTGDNVLITGVTGNTAANGSWSVTVVDANTVSLIGSTGNGAYISGGTVTYSETNDLGYVYGSPVVVKRNTTSSTDQYIVITGNGYNSLNGRAVLLIIDPTDGTILKKIDTGVGNCNGLSTPVAVDVDYDERADYVFAGDLKGNMWKFDLTDDNPANWDVAYKDHSVSPVTPKPIFQARGPGNTNQPITTRPDVMYHCQQQGYLVLFGTGQYLGDTDMYTTATQSIYGIWDYGDDYDDHEYLGSLDRATASKPLTNQPSGVALLEQTEIYWSGGVGALTQTYADWNAEDDAADQDGYSSNNEGTTSSDWRPNPEAPSGSVIHAGWYFDLPLTGERVVTDPLIRAGHAIVISYVPDPTPCATSGKSVITEVDACSGARLELPPFDINGDGMVSDTYELNDDGTLSSAGDFIYYNPGTGHNSSGDTNAAEKMIAPSRFMKDGRLMSPAIARLNEDIEIKIMSSSTANVATRNIVTLTERAAKYGIRYWFEVEGN